MISYAQNFEDVMLNRVFRNQTEGFYVDVGAADPTIESVTKHFYDKGWSGINIEPNEFFYSKLLTERPRDINLNLAIGESASARMLQVFERYGNSTFDPEVRDNFAARGFEWSEKTVRVTTLGAVCRDYVRREIDFLKIDCEGWEKNAIEGADWDRFRPKVLVVEATKPNSPEPSYSAWEPILLENGKYEMVYFDGLNRFYLRREYLDLQVHFQVPPNVFDGFELSPESGFVKRHLEEVRNSLNHRIELLKTELSAANQKHEQQINQLNAALAQSETESNQMRDAKKACDDARAAEQADLARARLWIGQLSQNLAILESTR
jgi:FkbM family methyltransferase